MVCNEHNWTKKTLPCPWLMCPNGTRVHWIRRGKKKVTYYVRVRNKDQHGPNYSWKKLPKGVVPGGESFEPVVVF